MYRRKAIGDERLEVRGEKKVKREREDSKMINRINSNKEWREIFVQRLLKFGVATIRLANKFPKTPAGFAIASQLIRSATSIGANFVEAQDASSIKDFVQKLSISLREARETAYWFKIVLMSELASEASVMENIKEGNEIISVLVSSVKSSKLKI